MYEKEIWKDVLDYEGIYEVSNFGRVKSKKRKVWVSKGGYYRTQTERILKSKIYTTENGKSYPSVALYFEGTKKWVSVCVIAAKAFLGLPPTDNYVVYHLDRNPMNNDIKNLKWISRSDLEHDIVGRKLIKLIELDRIFLSVFEASKFIQLLNPEKKNLSTISSHISAALTYRNPTAYGYHWEYITT